MSPQFSVLMTVFNRAELVREALESVFAQRHRDFEVIVVDDGSTDGTPAVLDLYSERISRLRTPNVGPAGARNAGIARARGTYVAVIDSDDRWFPWTLTAFDAALARSGPVALLAGELVSFTTNADLAGVTEGPLRVETFPDYLSSSGKGYFVGSCMAVYRREAVHDVGGFDASLINLEDHDLALRLGTARGFAKILSPVTLAYRHHAGSIQRVDRAYHGLDACLRKEAAGLYPGGASRRRDRRRILTLHSRPLSLRSLGPVGVGVGWSIYRRTFWWHVDQRRLRYLLGFPVESLLASLRRILGRGTGRADVAAG